MTSVTHQRDAMQITINEALFYTNLTDGKLIPWQAESFDLTLDFMTATIKLRKGVAYDPLFASNRDPSPGRDLLSTGGSSRQSG